MRVQVISNVGMNGRVSSINHLNGIRHTLRQNVERFNVEGTAFGVDVGGCPVVGLTHTIESS
jgi:hypothetical protein